MFIESNTPEGRDYAIKMTHKEVTVLKYRLAHAMKNEVFNTEECMTLNCTNRVKWGVNDDSGLEFCGNECYNAFFSSIENRDKLVNPYHMVKHGRMNREVSKNKSAYSRFYIDEYIEGAIENVEIGGLLKKEIHPHSTQFIRIEEGDALVKIYSFSGKDSKEYMLSALDENLDDYIVVPSNTYHEVVNTGNRIMKFYTIYGSPK